MHHVHLRLFKELTFLENFPLCSASFQQKREQLLELIQWTFLGEGQLMVG